MSEKAVANEDQAVAPPLRLGGPGLAEEPTGDIHEIELIKGTLLGRYHLGSKLTVGGTRQERWRFAPRLGAEGNRAPSRSRSMVGRAHSFRSSSRASWARWSART